MKWDEQDLEGPNLLCGTRNANGLTRQALSSKQFLQVTLLIFFTEHFWGKCTVTSETLSFDPSYILCMSILFFYLSFS